VHTVAVPAVPISDHTRPGWKAWALLAPMVVWLVAFVVIPGAILFVYSFCERDEVGGVVFSFTLRNYARVFDPVYMRSSAGQSAMRP
jgi:spermidine/putrescine transport system permease protein